MFRILPREESFFDLFEKAAANNVKAAQELVDLFEKFDDLPERAKRIKDLEHQGDAITHETLARVNRTFITPIDREDIHELVSRLDDVIDRVDTAVNRILLYGVERPMPDALDLARCLRHGTLLISEAIGLLRNMKNAKAIQEKCVAIHTQENEGDRIGQHALAVLFKNHHSPVDIIKWKDIYEDLEAATDRCEDVADVIGDIVLKSV